MLGHNISSFNLVDFTYGPEQTYLHNPVMLIKVKKKVVSMKKHVNGVKTNSVLYNICRSTDWSVQN